MSEERERILNLLEQGRINAREAAGLLDALDGGSKGDEGPAEQRTAARQSAPRYLLIKVEPVAGKETGPDAERVDVRVPLAILKAGIKLDAVLPGAAAAGVTAALNEHSMDFDLKGKSESAIDEFMTALAGFELDAEDGDHTIRVWTQ